MSTQHSRPSGGEPTPVEVAAVVAALSVVAAQADDPPAVRPRAGASRWADPATSFRVTPVPGPGAWSAPAASHR